MINPLNILDNLAKIVARRYVDFAYKRGFYEGGKITAVNKDFWNANSDFETTAKPDRDRLRARARWLSANNAIMDNIDNAIINNVIGTGIHLQSRTGKTKFDTDVEKLWLDWSNNPKACDATGRFTFPTMQRMILKTRLVDGEIFIYKRVTKDGLKLQLIEADFLDSTRDDGGVEIDGFGVPVRYHFLDSNNKKYTIDAKYIINYFMAERPTQYRGVSEYKQAILDIKNFSAFQTASIQGARARANIAYAVKHTSGMADNFNADLKEKIQQINGVSVLYLGENEDITKLDPDSVATDYVQFSENTIRLIATARKVSYELSFRDYSKVNFASSRASLLQDFKRFDLEQTHLVDYILNDIYKTWLEVEILAGRIKANGFEKAPDKWIKPKWIMPKRDLVDPLKEITAIEKKIKLNLTTETDVANSEGQDYEQILAKKAEEMKLKEKYGIPDFSLIEANLMTGGDDNEDGKVDFDENMTGAEASKAKGDNNA
jgi:lambda family phage portal protein